MINLKFQYLTCVFSSTSNDPSMIILRAIIISGKCEIMLYIFNHDDIS